MSELMHPPACEYVFAVLLSTCSLCSHPELLSLRCPFCVARTLHTATNALDTKWIAQQWVACGHAVPSAPVATKTFSLDVSPKESRQGPPGKAKGKKADKTAKKAVKKGFGAT